MGNSLPLPCVCHRCYDDEVETDAVVAGSAKRRKRKQAQQRPDDCGRNVRAAARPGHVVPVVDAPEDGGGGRGRGRVEPAGHGEGGGVLVRIVVRRQDIAQLVARLEQSGAAEEKNVAGVEEAGGTGLAGCDGSGGATMSPSRDAWRPRLSIIPENY